MSEVRYMISDAADKLGIEAHVLRYWEEELDLAVPRNEMGHRCYTNDWLHIFSQIRILKEKGYQLRAIKMLLHESQNCGEEEIAVSLGAALAQFDGLTKHGDTETRMVAPAVTEHLEGEKLRQFQDWMTGVVKTALQENAELLGAQVGDRVSDRVTEEMQSLLREQEARADERFRKLDETLRSRQQSLKEKRDLFPGRRRRKKMQKKPVTS